MNPVCPGELSCRLPVDGDDATVDSMRADIKKSKGAILTVEGGDFDNSGDKRMADYAWSNALELCHLIHWLSWLRWRPPKSWRLAV